MIVAFDRGHSRFKKWESLIALGSHQGGSLISVSAASHCGGQEGRTGSGTNNNMHHCMWAWVWAYPLYICVSCTEVIAHKHDDWSPVTVHAAAVQTPQRSNICQVLRASFLQYDLISAKGHRRKSYLFSYWKHIAQSTTQGHFRAFH